VSISPEIGDGSVSLAIARRRMRSTRLWSEPLRTPEQVVRWFGAVQAQEYEPAKWSVAIRATDADNSDLDRAVDAGRILRTHALRPTWHFVHPDDIRWIQALTGPRVHVLSRHYYKQLGLDDELLARSEQLIMRWISSEGDLTRKEVGHRLGVEGIEAEGSRLAYIMMSAELNGVVCSGTRRGAAHTYALVSQRAPSARELSEDEALVELVVRYFTSHGPATERDLAWWSSLTLSQIRRGLELAGNRLQREKLGDHQVWSADQAGPDVPGGPTVHLLQPYDEYTVAFSDTKHTVDAAGSTPMPLVVDGRAFYSALVVDGQLAGWWRRDLSRRQIEVEVRPSRPLGKAELTRLEEVAVEYGRFHNRPVNVSVV
jgi:Winged helix DNA-binding domain